MRDAITRPVNHEIASVWVQPLLRDARDLSIECRSRYGSGQTQLVQLLYRSGGSFADFPDALLILSVELIFQFGSHANFLEYSKRCEGPNSSHRYRSASCRECLARAIRFCVTVCSRSRSMTVRRPAAMTIGTRTYPWL